jgi:ceramide glucosyltransferase
VLTFAVPWTLVAVGAAHRAPWSWALLAAAILTRYLVAFVVGRVVLRDRQAWRDWWLILVRDFIAPLIWIGSYTGRTVAWRGDQFILKDGKLRPA